MSDPAEPIGARLARAGAAWRDDLPPLCEPDLQGVRARHRRWLVPSAAAAAVLLVVAGVAAVIGHDGRARPPAAAGSPSAGVVPWADLPATHPRIPSHRAGPSLDQVRAARPCVAGDLRPGTASSGAAAGTAYMTTHLSLASGHSPCRLSEAFSATLLDHVTRIPAASVSDLVDHPDVLLTRTFRAWLAVGWSVSHSCGHYDNTSIHVVLANGAGSFDLPGFGQTVCNPGEPMTEPIVMQPIRPGYADKRVSPYDGVRVSGRIPARARAGQPVDFTITMTSTRNIVLAPCPDYQITLYSRYKSEMTAPQSGLNCNAVPYRTSTGQPYLPANLPVRFAMRFTAPQHDVEKVVWSLVVPTPGLNVAGLVAVRR